MASGQRFLSVLMNVADQMLRGLAQRKTKSPSAPTQTGSSHSKVGPDWAPTTQRPGRTGAGAGSVHSGAAAELRERRARLDGAASPGQPGDTATFEVGPPAPGAPRISYEPAQGGDAGAGDVAWMWVPYDERDGRGKDRPVVVIGRAGDSHDYAVRLPSKSHDGDRDFLSIGAGSWDSPGRESWVDVDQNYPVLVRGLRSEAAVLYRKRFATFATALSRRYGWAS